MAETLMQLGDFRFALDNMTYQSLKRKHVFRWSSQARLLRRPAQQYIGLGEATLELSGTHYPQTENQVDALTRLRTQASQGIPLLLVDGQGFIWGQWVIVSIEETQTVFFANGAARKQEFQLQLQHYGED